MPLRERRRKARQTTHLRWLARHPARWLVYEARGALYDLLDDVLARHNLDDRADALRRALATPERGFVWEADLTDTVELVVEELADTWDVGLLCGHHHLMDTAERCMYDICLDLLAAAETVGRLIDERPDDWRVLDRLAEDLADVLAETTTRDGARKFLPSELALLRRRLVELQRRVALVAAVAGRRIDDSAIAVLTDLAHRLDILAAVLSTAGVLGIFDRRRPAYSHRPPAVRLAAQPIRRHGPPHPRAGL